MSVTLPEIPEQVRILSDEALAGAILSLMATRQWPDRLLDLQAEARRRKSMRRKGGLS